MAGISQERLNQIASRRLAKLGIAATPSADGPLTGAITFASLRHPSSGAPIVGGRFVVFSHDQLRFLDAPLASLAPVAFYDVATAALLEARIKGVLGRRWAAVIGVAERLHAFKLSPQLDADRLIGHATVSTSPAQFLLEAHPDGVRVARVRLAGGKEVVLGEGPLVDLTEHRTAIDLELALVAMLPALLERAQSQAQAPAAAEGSPASTPTSPGPLEAVAVASTLPALAFLLEKFGGLAATKAELALDFQDGTDTFRLLAAHVEGTVFRASIFRHSEPSQPLWQENVDFARVARASDVVATVLGRPVGVPAPQPHAPDIPDHLAPHLGEVWVMHVLIENDDESETRYVSTDADGRPYGAARVLARDVFRSVFVEHRGGWRLGVRIEEIRGDQVVYVQLDTNRQPSSERRTIPTSNLVAMFVPEASQY